MIIAKSPEQVIMNDITTRGARRDRLEQELLEAELAIKKEQLKQEQLKTQQQSQSFTQNITRGFSSKY